MREKERKEQKDSNIEKEMFFRGFEYITYYYRNKREIKENRRPEVGRLEYWLSSNKFKVLM